MFCYYADYPYAECRILFYFMLYVTMLSVVAAYMWVKKKM